MRLPRAVGTSRALDMILTGRAVGSAEALAWGLANRVVPDGAARPEAEALAASLAALPPRCMRSDRRSALGPVDRSPWAARSSRELTLGMETIASGETVAGASRFAGGAGRHGG